MEDNSFTYVCSKKRCQTSLEGTQSDKKKEGTEEGRGTRDLTELGEEGDRDGGMWGRFG